MKAYSSLIYRLEAGDIGRPSADSHGRTVLIEASWRKVVVTYPGTGTAYGNLR